MEVSPINTPHPDDKSTDEAELFFGEGEEEAQTEAAADPTAPVESAGPTEPPAPDPQPAGESAVAAAPEPDSGPETPATDEQQGEAAPASDAEGKKSSGSLERGYVVFHKLSLTKRALEFLLEEINSGNAPEPRVAYFKLHETQARRVEAAMADAYSRFQQQLGEKCDLAGVSSRAFQERHVEPKRVVETNLSIT